MRHLSLFALVLCLVVSVGCSSARPTAQSGPMTAAPVSQPVTMGPAMSQPTGAAPGERVIKVIQLPKGQTPYDLPDA